MAFSIFQLRNLTRVSLAAALLMAVSVGGFASKAFAGDDEPEDTIDTKFVKGVLGAIGLKDTEDPGIDYHERSPLVVPPTITLPPPESTSIATSNPAWPKDPDLTKKKKVKRQEKNAGAAEEDDMRQLSPSELNAARGPRTAATGDQSPQTREPTRGEQLMPSQLDHSGFTFGSLFGARNGTEVKFEKEPARTSLTDPPVGLRTPSSNYRYGTKGALEKEKNSNDQAVFGVDK